MPTPNTNNPYHCDRPMRMSGKTTAGSQRYSCKCGHTWTDSDLRAGRKPIGDRPFTQVELNQRYRAKKRANS